MNESRMKRYREGRGYDHRRSWGQGREGLHRSDYMRQWQRGKDTQADQVALKELEDRWQS